MTIRIGNITTTMEQCGNILISGSTGSGKTHLLHKLISQLPQEDLCIIDPKRIDYKEFNTFSDLTNICCKPIIIIDSLECLLPPEYKKSTSQLDLLFNLYLKNYKLIVATQYIDQKHFEKISICFQTRICMRADSEQVKQVLDCKKRILKGEALMKIKGNFELQHLIID